MRIQWFAFAKWPAIKVLAGSCFLYQNLSDPILNEHQQMAIKSNAQFKNVALLIDVALALVIHILSVNYILRSLCIRYEARTPSMSRPFPP